MGTATKDSIISLPAHALRQRSVKVGLITDEVRAVIDDMIAAAIDWEDSRPHEVGVALAAIQINQPLKIIVVRNNFDDKEDKSFGVLINPQIVKLEGEVTEDFEGCLSVKDVYGKVPRYEKLRLRALDAQGEPVRLRAEGFLARVIQHEVDHMNGTVFIDHIKDQPEAFYRLTDDGKLEKMESDEYEKLRTSGIFRD